MAEWPRREVLENMKKLVDESVSRMQPWCVANTQVTDSIQSKIVNDVSFGSEVRILATTLPQFCLPKLLQPRVLRFRSDEDRNVRVGVFPKREEILIGRLGLWRCRPATHRHGRDRDARAPRWVR